jgi:hypothetical protein
MSEWYSHITAINEAVADTKSDLAGLLISHAAVKAFLRGGVQYLELIKHRSLAEGKGSVMDGMDLALFSFKQLMPESKPKSEENEDG